MPQVQVVLLPKHLTVEQVHDRAVAVFDVLRATTSITAALAAEVKEVRVFGDLQDAMDAAAAFDGPKLLCGEIKTRKPPGFDLGNSPGAYNRQHHAGRTAFLSTTNGTRAIIAARAAGAVFTAALVNASTAASRLAETGRNVTLLCSGTGGQFSLEDVLGAGAVMAAMKDCEPVGDTARMAVRLFEQNRKNLREILRDCQGGRNILAAGLGEDIDFCSTLDSFNVLGRVYDSPLRVTR